MTAYEIRHAGTVLVVGSAPCATNDVAAALRIAPEAQVMTVNEGALLLRAHFLCSQHPEILPGLLYEHQRRFGCRPEVHAAVGLKEGREAPRLPGVDYWWPGRSSAATSAWGAVRVCKAMGFERVILCGCPVNGGDGYAMPTRSEDPSDPRLGFANPTSPLILGYQRAFWVAANEEGDGVHSMSGYTRLILGAPGEKPTCR